MDSCELSEGAPKRNAERRNRIWAFGLMGFLIALSGVAYARNELYIYFVAYLWFGFIFGACLQYGRFCFSSAFRDLFAVGTPRMVVGIVIATVLFSVTASVVTAMGMSTFRAAPMGIYNIIAGLVFGIGMVFAGGCASSSFYKTGEGNITSALVIVTMGVTQAVFVDMRGWVDKLVPASWHASALDKDLPASITAGDGWFNQYFAGHVLDQPAGTISKLLGLNNESVAGAFVGNFLVGVLLPASALLVIVFVFWSRKGFLKKRKRAGKSGGLKAELAGLWTMITSSRRTVVTGLILGVAAGLQMFVMKGLRLKFGIENAGEILTATGHDFGLSVRGTVHDPGHWSVATHSAQWFGWVFNKLGWDNMHSIFFGYSEGIPNPIFNFAAWMSIAVIFGAAVMALLHNEFQFKKPTLELATWAVFGGALMGIGARLGLGCNIGAFFARAANGDPSGWLFGVGMTGGAYIGVRFFKWWTERKMAKEMGVAPDLQP